MNILHSIAKFFNPARARNHALVRDHYPTVWQRNDELYNPTSVSEVAYSAVSLISRDVGKLPLVLKRYNVKTGVWKRTTSAAYSPILRKPNSYQTRAQFIQSWVVSVLMTGNAFVMLRRDDRAVPREAHVLDPTRVQVCTDNEGNVFYRLNSDDLAGIGEQVYVPASEIIHDRETSLTGHPLIGVSPLEAALYSLNTNKQIQRSNANAFNNQSRLSGYLSAPGAIEETTAQEIRTYWASNYAGAANAGKVAVLADGLQWHGAGSVLDNAALQALELLEFSAKNIAAVFHCPLSKLGYAESDPNNVEAENLKYFSDALSARIAAMEELLEHGLGLPNYLKISFDVDQLYRLDFKAGARLNIDLVAGGILSTNEARARIGEDPVEGGQHILRQIQDVPLYLLDGDVSNDNGAQLPKVDANGKMNAADVEKYFAKLNSRKKTA